MFKIVSILAFALYVKALAREEKGKGKGKGKPRG